MHCNFSRILLPPGESQWTREFGQSEVEREAKNEKGRTTWGRDDACEIFKNKFEAPFRARARVDARRKVSRSVQYNSSIGGLLLFLKSH